MKGFVLTAVYLIQGVLNLVFYGIPSIMFSVLLPQRVFREVAWLLPFLVLLYFAIGAFSLYYLGLSPVPKRGKYLGAVYFSLGLFGSTAVSLEPAGETPLLRILFIAWAFLSLLGLLLIFKVKNLENVQPLLLIGVLLVLFFSGAVSFLTAQWIVEDYYVHVHMNESVPENATVMVAYPENVSPPNGTG
ncbi:hypothetical protein [Thermococcus sp.]|uniref:hypothetical protein n=1 Tax=Thermococcus sp. TaxID=35749 RepID=UPI002635B341|nr:hypothetical protein [Thermococcus sp.]